jgi:glyoxylase-like metal-dependent hydrolase (beta-lactamase superfamily II)
LEIYPNIFMITGLASRQYLIVENDGVTLIDTGLATDHKKIDRSIKNLGITPFHLKQILITHADGDHYGGVNLLKLDYPGVVVRSSDIEAAAMKSGSSSRMIIGKGFRGIFFNIAGKIIKSEPTEAIGDLVAGMELLVMGGLEVLNTSGHTPGHISFFLKEHSLLFTGDSILVHGNELVPSTGANTWDLNKAKLAFDSQLALDPAIIAGGHGWLKRK